MKKLDKNKIAYLANLLGDVSRLKKSKLKELILSCEAFQHLNVDDLISDIRCEDRIYREELRLTLTQKIIFNHKAQMMNCTVSELIRKAVENNLADEILQLNLAASLNKELLGRIHGEVNAIGRNLNQVAKHCSSLASINMKADTRALTAQLQVTHVALVHVGMMLEAANPAYQEKKYELDSVIDNVEFNSFTM